jgi:hypothetical protein
MKINFGWVYFLIFFKKGAKKIDTRAAEVPTNPPMETTLCSLIQ